VWPKAVITGIDVWGPSLERARANVRGADLDGRITLRTQDVAELDDVDTYDCAWVPTFFLDDSVLDAALPRVVRATVPGGWIVLGLFADPPVALAKATNPLKTIRGGGTMLSEDNAQGRLEQAGCVGVHARARSGPGLAFVLGQRPS
jgi:hypothetical protein